MNRLDRLVAARDRLEAAMEGCKSPRDLSALNREYRQTLAEIGSLRPQEATSQGVDEITRRRAARAAGASNTGRAKRPG